MKHSQKKVWKQERQPSQGRQGPPSLYASLCHGMGVWEGAIAGEAGPSLVACVAERSEAERSKDTERRRRSRRAEWGGREVLLGSAFYIVHNIELKWAKLTFGEVLGSPILSGLEGILAFFVLKKN